MENRYHFECDYTQGFDEKVLNKLVETNMVQTVGYGLDPYCQESEALVKSLCNKEVNVFHLVGGTQANSVVIQHCLKQYEAVIACDSGHINVHETGAIEHNGHKVVTIPGVNGKLNAADVVTFMEPIVNDSGKEHIVLPKMIYISQTSEYGTMYSKEELQALRDVANRYGLIIFMDGARLGYALAADSRLKLADYAQLVDVFTIGLTKCGGGFGEVVVFDAAIDTHRFRNVIKQNGAMLAKGRLLGVSALALLSDNHYQTICANALRYADKIREALKAKGVVFYIENNTNQIFPIVSHAQRKLLEKAVVVNYWGKYNDEKDIIRIVTSWGNTDNEVNALLSVIDKF